MYYQRVSTECSTIAVEWAAISCLGDTAIVEIIGVAALGTGGVALHAYVEANGGEVA